MLRWVMRAGVSCVLASLAVLGVLSLLPKRTHTAMSNTAVGWLVMGLAVSLFVLLPKRTKERDRS